MTLYFLGEKYLKPRYNKIIFFYMFLSSARQPNASISIESDVSEKEKKKHDTYRQEIIPDFRKWMTFSIISMPPSHRTENNSAKDELLVHKKHTLRQKPNLSMPRN